MRFVKRKFLKSLLILGAIGVTLTVGIGKLVATVGSISGLALKFAFSTLLVAPFKAAIRFIRGNVENFVKNFKNYAKNLIRKGPGKLLGFLNPKNLLLGGGAFGSSAGAAPELDAAPEDNGILDFRMCPHSTI